MARTAWRVSSEKAGMVQEAAGSTAEAEQIPFDGRPGRVVEWSTFQKVPVQKPGVAGVALVGVGPCKNKDDFRLAGKLPVGGFHFPDQTVGSHRSLRGAKKLQGQFRILRVAPHGLAGGGLRPAVVSRFKVKLAQLSPDTGLVVVEDKGFLVKLDCLHRITDRPLRPGKGKVIAGKGLPGNGPGLHARGYFLRWRRLGPRFEFRRTGQLHRPGLDRLFRGSGFPRFASGRAFPGPDARFRFRVGNGGHRPGSGGFGSRFEADTGTLLLKGGHGFLRLILPTAPFKELVADVIDIRSLQPAGIFGIELGQKGLGIGKPLCPDCRFKQAEKRLVAHPGVALQGPAEPGLCLGEVFLLEVKPADGHPLPGPGLQLVGCQKGFKGLVQAPGGGQQVSKGYPDRAVPGTDLEVGPVLVDGPFHVAGFHKSFRGIQEILRLLRHDFRNPQEGQGSEHRIALGGVGEGKGLENIHALRLTLLAAFEDPDGILDLPGVQKQLRLLHQFLNGWLAFAAARQNQQKDEPEPAGMSPRKTHHVCLELDKGRSLVPIEKMKALWYLMAMTLLSFSLFADNGTFWGYEGNPRQPYHGKLWKGSLEGFSREAYAREVDRLFRVFESATGRELRPGVHGKAALKIYTNSGLGLQTPRHLVRAVIDALLARGFSRDGLCIVDARREMLRDAGYLPPLSRIPLQGPYFEGIRVYSIDSGELKSPTWYYENPLPMEFTTPLGRSLLVNELELDPQEARKSYLPENLLTEVDFWINLPVACHNPATGLSGALVNASLWNLTNGTRFFNSRANAPVAVAEVASIPELQARWALNLVSLETYQYIAGPAFNAHYTGSLPELWLSVDPVVMDTSLVRLLNDARRAAGFELLPLVPEFVQYSMELGLGQGYPVEQRPGDPAQPVED